jgi:integrase
VRRSIVTREGRTLLRACDDGTIKGLRDGAIISLMLLAGLRRQEVVSLDRNDYDPEGGCLGVQSGSAPTRLLALEADSREALEAWLATCDVDSGPMFISIQGGEARSSRLTLSAVNRLLSRRCEEAGCRRLTPRDLRSHFLRQLQTAIRLGAHQPCRFQQTEDGGASWILSSLPSPGRDR